MKQHIIMHDQKMNQMAYLVRTTHEEAIAFFGKSLLVLAIWGSGFLAGLS
jgi:hypothetical protein